MEEKLLGEEEDQDLKNYKKAMKKLVLVSVVSTFFVVCQCIGGYLANSVAIFTDTAHLASDMLGFLMSIVALKMTLRDASKEHTYGWQRAEIIGTLMSVIFLVILTLGLLVAAMFRIVTPEKVKGKEMLITAVMSLCFNLIQMRILHQDDGHYHFHDEQEGGHSHGGEKHVHDEEETGHEHGEKSERNVNVDAAFLHALGDMVMSIGVCIAAVIIYFWPKMVYADSFCTFVFSIIVCFTVIPLTKQCLNVMMEAAPKEVDSEALIHDLKAVCKGNVRIHDFHVWSLSVNKYALSCHIDCSNPMEALRDATKLCQEKYKIDHTTFQMENSEDEEFKFKC